MAINPIPSHARCVYKGVIFEVWQWDQKMFDGSTQVFERVKRANTTQILATVNDQLILVRERQPDSGWYLSLPGGRCEDGESEAENATRELLEETGYTSSDWSLLDTFTPAAKVEWVVHTFVARSCAFVKPPALDAGEDMHTVLFDFDSFLNLTEDESFYAHEINHLLLRARYVPTVRDALKKKLFG